MRIKTGWGKVHQVIEGKNIGIRCFCFLKGVDTDFFSSRHRIWENALTRCRYCALVRTAMKKLFVCVAHIYHERYEATTTTKDCEHRRESRDYFANSEESVGVKAYSSLYLGIRLLIWSSLSPLQQWASINVLEPTGQENP